MIETAKNEGYYDENKVYFSDLEKVLKHDINQDIIDAKEEISELLAAEIVKRYYFQRGELQQLLKNDKELKRAIEIVSDQDTYQTMLKP